MINHEQNQFSVLIFICCLAIILGLTSCSSCSNYEVSVPHNSDGFSPTAKPVLDVYIENSGSMDGYVLDKSDFRDDLYEYISKLQNSVSGVNLNYINSRVIPIREPLESFFMNLNVASFKAGGGRRNHSDIIDMMKAMLSRNNNNTVTLFASDCILDLQGDTKAFLHLEKTTLANVIQEYRKKHPNFGIRILCLQSVFDGYLYPMGKAPVKIIRKRPYYLWIFGPNYMIGQLMKNVPDSTFGSDLLYGVAFSDISEVPVNLGKTNEDMSKDGAVTLKNSNPKFDLYVNLSRTLLDDNTIENKNSYELSPFLQIDKIGKINYSKSEYTHIIHLNLIHVSNANNIKLALKKNGLPVWVDKMNDESGDNPRTTCGIKYLIGGVMEAFDDVRQITMDLKISKK